jgi:hypothetical protein
MRELKSKSYLSSVARGYRQSAWYHEESARIAEVEGDIWSAAQDRAKASEYRKLAHAIEGKAQKEAA